MQIFELVDFHYFIVPNDISVLYLIFFDMTLPHIFILRYIFTSS